MNVITFLSAENYRNESLSDFCYNETVNQKFFVLGPIHFDLLGFSLISTSSVLGFYLSNNSLSY